MPQTPSDDHPKEPPVCWLCSKPIADPADATALLGLGALDVHRACYKRALGGRPVDDKDAR